MAASWTIGVIGGSGIYDLASLEESEWLPVSSPYGKPSDEILFGRIGNVELRFLPRHGRGHRIAPGAINARANIDALKRSGCTDIIAVSAIGSLQEELEPGRFVVVDQFIDRTCTGLGDTGRAASFFGSGLIAHVSMADPVCERLSAMAGKAVQAAGGRLAQGGTYLAMEGPQFSTRAESRLYRAWGADVIGMTGMPEARLAREAELPYALVGMVTDYDCWRSEDETVEVGDVLAQMRANSATARSMIEHFVAALPEERTPSPIDTALDGAIITAPDARDPAMLVRAEALLARLLAS